MFETAKKLISRTLRIPPKPDPPLGAPGSLRVFRAAEGFWRYRVLRWSWQQCTVVVGFVAAFLFTRRVFGAALWGPEEAVDKLVDRIRNGAEVAEHLRAPIAFLIDALYTGFVEGMLDFLVVGFLLVQAPISFLLARLNYESRWYMVTDRSLRIREGVWTVREQTMTFSNIQNIAIRQGPLQRLFGISDLEVRTAGGGSKSGDAEASGNTEGNLHLGYFRGVSNPREIHDAIKANWIDGVGAGRSGAEAPADSAARSARDADALRAARTALEEARKLRQAADSTSFAG